MARAGELGADPALKFLREVDNINMRRRIRMVELAGMSVTARCWARDRRAGRDLRADSDDIRDSPVPDVARAASTAGRGDRMADPAAGEYSRPSARRWTTPTH